MKTKIIIFLAFWSNILLHSQNSIIIYDPGTTLDIQAGADVCPDSLVMNGTFTGNGTICELVVVVNPISAEIPNDYKLFTNYPNPFNPVTKIQFDIPKSSFTKVLIYDVTGRIIQILVNEELIPGKYEVYWDASHRASGVYYYKLEAENYSETKKMILLK